MHLHPFTFSCCIALLLVCAGCDVQPPSDEPEPAEPPSPWRDGSVAVEEEGIDEELEQAMAQARESAEQARQRWEKMAESQRTRWAVKWAAPTADGGVEYLWVQPLHWSPFRVEGLLASDPVHELAADQQRGLDDEKLAVGDLVAFPIEQLADWVHLLEGDVAGPREGGFTIDVLEKRYGKPPERNRG